MENGETDKSKQVRETVGKGKDLMLGLPHSDYAPPQVKDSVHRWPLVGPELMEAGAEGAV